MKVWAQAFHLNAARGSSRAVVGLADILHLQMVDNSEESKTELAVSSLLNVDT